jgi:hypothetical protein
MCFAFRKSRVDYYREGDYRNTGFGSKYNYYDAGEHILSFFEQAVIPMRGYFPPDQGIFFGSSR